MKIEIYDHIQEIALKKAAKMKMSVTQFVNFIIEIAEVKVEAEIKFNDKEGENKQKQNKQLIRRY